MTARQMFKGNRPDGKVLKCSKGGYDYGLNTFAYCICDDGQKYNVKVLSDVNPREYSVDYGEKTDVTSLEMAILYNEWRARVIASKNRQKNNVKGDN